MRSALQVSPANTSLMSVPSHLLESLVCLYLQALETEVLLNTTTGPGHSAHRRICNPRESSPWDISLCSSNWIDHRTISAKQDRIGLSCALQTSSSLTLSIPPAYTSKGTLQDPVVSSSLARYEAP
eukprot:489883-Hanusia_phi.AAC.4